LRIEEKKDNRTYDGAPNPALYNVPEEKALAKAIEQVKTEASAAVANEDFAIAMSAMAKLRPAVDAFFDKVKVNDDDVKVRENRLKLLNEIRAATARWRIFPKYRISSRAPDAAQRAAFAAWCTAEPGPMPMQCLLWVPALRRTGFASRFDVMRKQLQPPRDQVLKI